MYFFRIFPPICVDDLKQRLGDVGSLSGISDEIRSVGWRHCNYTDHFGWDERGSCERFHHMSHGLHLLKEISTPFNETQGL